MGLGGDMSSICIVTASEVRAPLGCQAYSGSTPCGPRLRLDVPSRPANPMGSGQIPRSVATGLEQLFFPRGKLYTPLQHGEERIQRGDSDAYSPESSPQGVG